MYTVYVCIEAGGQSSESLIEAGARIEAGFELKLCLESTYRHSSVSEVLALGIYELNTAQRVVTEVPTAVAMSKRFYYIGNMAGNQFILIDAGQKPLERNRGLGLYLDIYSMCTDGGWYVGVGGGGGGGGNYSVFTWVDLIPVEVVYIYCSGGGGGVKSCLLMLLTSYASTRKGWVDC